MSRIVVGVFASLMIAMPVAQAQGVSLGPTQRSSTANYGQGSYYYPGFGYSSVPMNTGPYYGGYGYGYANGYPAPIYSAPVAVPGLQGFFRIGNARLNYWQAPSGYYYPWAAGTTGYVQQQPIYIVQQGQTQAQQPPLSSMFSDMETYIDDCQKKGKLTQTDYQRLFRRLQDLRSKFDHERSAAGGTLDPSDEESMRREASNLGGEIARAVKPLAKQDK